MLVLLTAVLLAWGITGGAVLAQEGVTRDQGARQSMAARVAAILGRGEEEVESAFKQASRKMPDEKFENRMDRLVEKGQITEDEAAEAVDWYKSQHEDTGPGRRGFGMKGRGTNIPAPVSAGSGCAAPADSPTADTEGGSGRLIGRNQPLGSKGPAVALKFVQF